LIVDFPFSFNEKSSLLLIFFFVGLVFSFLTLRIGVVHDNKASKWLGLLLLLCAMYITPHMLGYANWYSQGFTRETLLFVPFMQVFLIGPVVYFYTKSLLNTEFRLSRKDYVHFLPAILYGLYSLVVFVTDKLILDEFYFYADGRDKDLSNWYQGSGLISMVIYLVLSLRFYSNYKKRVFNEVSYAETVLFHWIRNFMIAFLGLLILRALFFVLNPDWGEFGSQFWYYLSFSFIFTYVAIAGYSNVIKYATLAEAGLKAYNVFQEEAHTVSGAAANGLVAEEEPPREIDEASPELAPLLEKKEGRSQLDDDEISAWKGKLQRVMSEDQLYENPRLTLADVAAQLDTTTKLVSTVVNRGFAMNFNDYVNQFRIEAVKKKLGEGEQVTKTLLAVALECGFNSKATFNRAFKKNTSSSPKEYLEKLAKK